jgi:hypothetical protein
VAFLTIQLLGPTRGKARGVTVATKTPQTSGSAETSDRACPRVPELVFSQCSLVEPVGFARGFVFMDESAEEMPAL